MIPSRTWNFPMGKRAAIIAAAVLLAMSLGARAQDALVVAATTSVEDSGLFDHITPLFTAKTGIAVRIVPRSAVISAVAARSTSRS